MAAVYHIRGQRRKETPEGQLTKQIRKVLRLLHVYHWKQWQGIGSGMPGVSDILGIYKGRFLAIEIKAPGGRLSPAQKIFLDNVKEEGGVAILAYSVDDVIKGLGVEGRFKRPWG